VFRNKYHVPKHVPGYRWRGGNTTRHQREGKISGLEVFAQSRCRAPIAMNTSVHCSNDRVLRLIELFQDNQCLWNCQHVDYKNRICKADAWNSIANEMGIPRASVEAKIHKVHCIHSCLPKTSSSTFRSSASTYLKPNAE
jgi:hypothetical protein